MPKTEHPEDATIRALAQQFGQIATTRPNEEAHLALLQACAGHSPEIVAGAALTVVQVLGQALQGAVALIPPTIGGNDDASD